MRVTVWRSGTRDDLKCSYGLKIEKKDREEFFCKEWDYVIVKLPNGEEVKANTNKPSFWNDSCRELINVKFREWFIDEGLTVWDYGRPPKLELTPVSDQVFRLTKIKPGSG